MKIVRGFILSSGNDLRFSVGDRVVDFADSRKPKGTVVEVTDPDDPDILKEDYLVRWDRKIDGMRSYYMRDKDLISESEYLAEYDDYEPGKALTPRIIKQFSDMIDITCDDLSPYSEGPEFRKEFLDLNLQPGHVLTEDEAKIISTAIGNGWEMTGKPRSFAKVAKQYGVDLLSYTL